MHYIDFYAYEELKNAMVLMFCELCQHLFYNHLPKRLIQKSDSVDIVKTAR